MTSDPTPPSGPSAPQSAQAQTELRNKARLLHEFIKKSIEDVGKKRKLNQKKATLVKVSILCFSGGATILLGLNLGTMAETPVKNVAFALSSVVTLLNALEPFFNYRGLWVEHEKANAAFYHVKDKLEFYTAGRADEDLESKEIDKFYDQYEQVWSTLNHAWTQQRVQPGDGATKLKPS